MPKENPTEALIKIAESFEKLAKSIEEDGAREEKTAHVSQVDPDYGTLGRQSLDGTDPLTKFLLS